jgi:hypothetical protein
MNQNEVLVLILLRRYSKAMQFGPNFDDEEVSTLWLRHFGSEHPRMLALAFDSLFIKQRTFPAPNELKQEVSKFIDGDMLCARIVVDLFESVLNKKGPSSWSETHEYVLTQFGIEWFKERADKILEDEDKIALRKIIAKQLCLRSSMGSLKGVPIFSDVTVLELHPSFGVPDGLVPTPRQQQGRLPRGTK